MKLIDGHAMIERVNDAQRRGAVDLSYVLIVKEAVQMQPAVDAVPMVRCAYCKHCYDIGNDPMEPYDGESDWYCARFDRDTSAYEIDPYMFFCADGERRESE